AGPVWRRTGLVGGAVDTAAGAADLVGAARTAIGAAGDRAVAHRRAGRARERAHLARVGGRHAVAALLAGDAGAGHRAHACRARHAGRLQPRTLADGRARRARDGVDSAR